MSINMAIIFTIIFMFSLFVFFVKIKKDKNNYGKISIKSWSILTISIIAFLMIGATYNGHSTKKDKSINSEIDKLSSSQKSSESVNDSYNFSNVKYGMTMDEVISAIGKQPTDRDDYTLYYGTEDFDFNDNKLIGSSVKSVQDKIDQKYKNDSEANADKNKLKSQASYFGKRSVEYLQKHSSAYSSDKIDNGMRYMYFVKKGSYLVRYDTDDGYTNIFSYDGNGDNKLGDKLYTGKTIFNQPETKKYYYIGGK